MQPSWSRCAAKSELYRSQVRVVSQPSQSCIAAKLEDRHAAKLELLRSQVRTVSQPSLSCIAAKSESLCSQVRFFYHSQVRVIVQLLLQGSDRLVEQEGCQDAQHKTTTPIKTPSPPHLPPSQRRGEMQRT